MNPDPVEQVDGLTTADPVSKSGFVDYQKTRTIGLFATASELRNTNASGRSRIMVGSRFFRKDTEDTSADDMTESSPVIVDAAGTHWLMLEGEHYPVSFGMGTLVSDGEETIPHIFTTPVQLLAGMPGSKFRLRTGPAGEAVFTIMKYSAAADTHATIGTITFGVGETEGTIAFAADVSFVRDDELYIVAPDPRDASLYTFYGTAACVR